MKNKIGTFLLFFIYTFSYAQNQLGTQLKWNDSDFFVGIFAAKNIELHKKDSLSRKYFSIEPQIGLSTGIVRTFFQRRMYPTMFVSNTFYLLQSKRVAVGPKIQTEIATLNYNKNIDRNLTQFFYSVGYQLKVGSGKSYFSQSSMLGMKNEYWPTEMNTKNKYSHPFLDFQFSFHYKIG
jgi:hypothetical protein